jgi:subtilase family serine protease
VLDPDGERVFSAFTFGLDPGEETTYESMLRVTGCDPLTYTIEADSANSVLELDEGNNTARVRLYPDLRSLVGCADSSPLDPINPVGAP